VKGSAVPDMALSLAEPAVVVSVVLRRTRIW